MTPTAPRPLWRCALGVLGTAVAIALFAFWALVLRPVSMGGSAQYVAIHGNSMFPLYQEDDFVITHHHAEYAVGDVVAYRVPPGQLGGGLMVIHRIVGGSASTGYVLKGDNNPIADPWHPVAADVVGTTWVHVPRLGKLFVAIHRPIVPGLFFGALAVVAVLCWTSRRIEPEEALQVTLGHLDRVTTALETRYSRGTA